MENISYLHIVGMAIILGLVMAIGIFSGKNIKNANDFSTGGNKAGFVLISGAMIGTLIGGASTIGTAQLAFDYGLSAWWFTLGTGLGGILYGFIMTKPLRHCGFVTLQQLISDEYGDLIGIVTSVLSSIGLVINVVTQILSANALLTAIFGIIPQISSFITIIIILCYVVFGGVLGTGILGSIKLVLTLGAVILAIMKIYTITPGFSPIFSQLPVERYLNIFARGFLIDFGSFISVTLGVLFGQAYMQIVLSGKNDEVTKKATILSSLLVPLVGLGSILVGMYMRVNYPSISANQAFPIFIINHMHPLVGGVILATLMLALVGTASGTVLAMGTIFTKDIYKKFIDKDLKPDKELKLNRLTISIVLVLAAIVSSANVKSSILTWGYIATGLRGIVLMFPVIGAIYFKSKIDTNYAILSSVVGSLTYIIGKFFIKDVDSLLIAIPASLLCFLIGYNVKKKSVALK